MEENKLKNIVVLKNLPSNIVDEAIVVLKENKVKLPEYTPKKEEKVEKENSREYILKEAQMVIADYLSTVENKKMIVGKKTEILEKKYRRLRLCTFGLVFVVIVGIFL